MAKHVGFSANCLPFPLIQGQHCTALKHDVLRRVDYSPITSCFIPLVCSRYTVGSSSCNHLHQTVFLSPHGLFVSFSVAVKMERKQKQNSMSLLRNHKALPAERLQLYCTSDNGDSFQRFSISTQKSVCVWSGWSTDLPVKGVTIVVQGTPWDLPRSWNCCQSCRDRKLGIDMISALGFGIRVLQRCWRTDLNRHG